MARANIDLSWLAQLLTKTPTAGNSVNPDYNQSESVPYLDPVTGQSSGVMPNNTPFKAPSSWQHMVWPEQSGAIDAMNNQSVSKPLSASLNNASDIAVRTGNVARLPHMLQPPGMTPQESAIAGYGDFSPPTILNQQNRAALAAQGGVPSTLARTDITQAGIGEKAATGEAGRQDVQESILDQDTLNHWFTSFHLTPLQSQLAEKQLRSETGVQPLVAQIRERALQNQQQQEEHLVPAQTQLALTQTGNAQNIASETGRLWPYTKTSLDNRAIADAATSHYIPLMDRFANTIDSDNVIHPFSRNPLGASPFKVQMESLGDISGAGGGQTIKDSSGKTYRIPAAPPSNIDPLTGGPTITSTNGPSVSDDRSGSMAPPVNQTLSSNTLGTQSRYTDQIPTDVDAIRSEMARLEPTFYQYPNSESGRRYQILKKQLDKFTATSNSHITPSMHPLGLNIP